MALADALGNLIDFRLLPGQAHDLCGTAALIDGLSCCRVALKGEMTNPTKSMAMFCC
jgi:hypothetical protein